MQPRVSSLDEVGSLDAPPGSRAWAAAVRLEMQGLIKDHTSSAKHLATWREIMEKYEGWRALSDAYGEPFSTYAEFCKAPVPYGLGHDPAMIDALVKERMSIQALNAIDQKTQRPIGTNQYTQTEDVDIVNTQPARPDGNSRQYALRRLRNTKPELHKRMLVGELSPNAAMIEAGFRRKTLTIPTDATGAAHAILRHFDADAVAEIVAILTGSVED